MGTRGKCTATIKALNTIALERIKPPVHLSAKQKQIWKSIVDELPENHFIKADIPLLESYVYGIGLMRNAALMIDEPYKDDTPIWIKTFETQQNRLGNLAVKLRLTPNSRTRADTLKIEDKPASSRKLS